MRHAIPAIVVVAALGVAPVSAQQNVQDFTDWVHVRLAELAAARLPDPGAAVKQVEPPAAAGGTTSLVDQSGAPDLAGLSIDLFGVGGSDGGNPMTMTVSAYALRSGLTGRNPLRPELYQAGRNWRRWSFTVGHEAATDEVAESQVFGIKYLAIDQRDLGAAGALDQIRASLAGSTVASTFSGEIAGLQDLLAQLLGPRLGETDPIRFAQNFLSSSTINETVGRLSDEEQERVDAFLVERIEPAIEAAGREQAAKVAALQKRPQLALSYVTNQRETGNADEHHWGAIFDWGLADRLNLTVNTSVAIVDELANEDSHFVKAGGEFQWQVPVPGMTALEQFAAGRTSLTLNLSVANEWHAGRPGIHKAQVKVKVPLGGILRGMTLPISLTVANRPDLVEEREIRGQVGFTVDVSKLQQALRPVGR
jgi:hypothetical protein